jgi:heme/copper-type cytochrome/quinol oxidase subunit 1
VASEQVLPGWRDGAVVQRLFSVDHKHVGKLFLGFGTLFLVGLGIDRLLLFLDLAHAPEGLLGELGMRQATALSGTMAIVHVGLALTLGLAAYLVPLQIGARRTAWPLALTTGFWLYLGGAVAMLGAFTTGKPQADAVTAPLSADGERLWFCGAILVAVGTAAVAADLLTTVARRRADGMTWSRVPVFTFSAAAFAVTLLAAAVVTVAMAAVHLVDADAARGFFTFDFGTATYLQSPAWYAGHPLTYAVLVPVIGMLAEALATLARRDALAERLERLERLAIVAAAVLSVALSVYHLLADAFGETFADGVPFASIIALAALAPAALAVLVRLPRARRPWRPEVVLAAGAALVAAVGTVLAFALGFPSSFEAETGSLHLFAHLDGTLASSALLGLAAGSLYWFPKLTGRLFDERASRGAAGLLVLGALCLVVGLHIAGEGDLQAWSSAAKAGTSLALAGYLLMFLGAAAALAGAAASVRVGTRVGNDPWLGDTLEWYTTSPPPPRNFARVPAVESARPLHDLRARLGSGPPAGARRA